LLAVMSRAPRSRLGELHPRPVRRPDARRRRPGGSGCRRSRRRIERLGEWTDSDELHGVKVERVQEGDCYRRPNRNHHHVHGGRRCSAHALRHGGARRRVPSATQASQDVCRSRSPSPTTRRAPHGRLFETLVATAVRSTGSSGGELPKEVPLRPPRTRTDGSLQRDPGSQRPLERPRDRSLPRSRSSEVRAPDVSRAKVLRPHRFGRRSPGDTRPCRLPG
jgi:hypothetical protein